MAEELAFEDEAAAEYDRRGPQPTRRVQSRREAGCGPTGRSRWICGISRITAGRVVSTVPTTAIDFGYIARAPSDRGGLFIAHLGSS